MLPPRYQRLHLLRHNARESKINSTLSDRWRLNDITGRYERHAMRAMVRSVKGLLASGAHRRVERLSLEVFAYDTSACINRLVVDAVDSWGVRDLEVVATRTGPFVFPKPLPYSFPCGVISINPGESRLRSLKLANCLPPPLHGFTALTTLVLRDLPVTTPAATYEGVVTACPQLHVLHLVSCKFTSRTHRVLLDVPMSEIRELLVDGRHMVVEIRSLPKLENLTSLHLESLYVHVAHGEDEPSDQQIPWETSAASRHRHLKQLVVIGFRTTERQLRLVRFAVEVSTGLRRVTLLKYGHVVDKGPCCDWEVLSQQSAWSGEEKLTVLDGIGCSTGQIEMVLG
jgi:hypothetical protein